MPMLTQAERDMVFRNAFVPEHLPDYVQAISFAEPYIHEGYLCYSHSAVLIFIGYRLEPGPTDQQKDISSALESACERFQPITVNVIASRIQAEIQSIARENDQYFRLNLPMTAIRPEEAYMVRRARRELNVIDAAFSREHELLIENFLSERNLSTEHQEIFRKIPRYFERSQTARLLEARKGNELVAFTIVDLGSADYAFYLFNFRSRTLHVPGASDLLFHEMARLAANEGKRYLNLGLGVNPGVQRFKKKWGAMPFLSYESATIHRRPRGLIDIVREMLGFGV